MKSRNLLLVLVILSFGTMLALAQAAPEGGGMGSQEGGRRGRGMMNADRLTEQLNLTPDQKTKVEAILQDQRSQMMALRQDSSMSQEDRRDKMQEITKTSSGKIRDILTDEQREKFDKMGPQGPGGRTPGGPPQESPQNN
jgi:Spy/CpxP family protein refolding chaperone